jgi:predicted RNA-binding Zn-ribbon protein involved in translation (DUF1610 family)
MDKISCPLCGKSVSNKPLKFWQFGKYNVNRYECPNCKGKFNIYRSQTKTFTIPRTK